MRLRSRVEQIGGVRNHDSVDKAAPDEKRADLHRDIARMTAAPVRSRRRGREIYQRFRHVAFLSTTVRDKGYLTDANGTGSGGRRRRQTAEGGLFIPISWREEKFLLGSLPLPSLVVPTLK